MRVSRSTLLWSLGTLMVAVAASWVVSRNAAGPSGQPSELGFHEWLHANLSMTAAQHAALQPHETSFETERLRLRGEIREAGSSLAAAIRESGGDTPEVETALRRLQAAQAELQQVTLRHFFLMKDHLDPAQAEKLLLWTHDSLLDGNSD